MFFQIFNGKVVHKTDAGLDVALLKSDHRVLIPAVHMSDHLSNCDLLLDSYKDGQNVKGAVFLSTSGNVIVSLTESETEGSRPVRVGHISGGCAD